jgi:hypothetical protein
MRVKIIDASCTASTHSWAKRWASSVALKGATISVRHDQARKRFRLAEAEQVLGGVEGRPRRSCPPVRPQQRSNRGPWT